MYTSWKESREFAFFARVNKDDKSESGGKKSMFSLNLAGNNYLIILSDEGIAANLGFNDSNNEKILVYLT